MVTRRRVLLAALVLALVAAPAVAFGSLRATLTSAAEGNARPPLSDGAPVDPGRKAVPPSPPGGATVKQPAPIERVDVRAAESLPPQYFADVTIGLPSGCAQPGGYEVERQDDVVRITASILVPADPSTICTMIYGTHVYHIALGSEFTPGRTYIVEVNGTKTPFTAE